MGTLQDVVDADVRAILASVYVDALAGVQTAWLEEEDMDTKRCVVCHQPAVSDKASTCGELDCVRAAALHGKKKAPTPITPARTGRPVPPCRFLGEEIEKAEWRENR